MGWEDTLEKGKDTHSSILAWRNPWTVWSMGSQRVRHNWATFTFTLSLWELDSTCCNWFPRWRTQSRKRLSMQEKQEKLVQSLDREDHLEVAWQPTLYFWLANPMDRGAWRATVHGVAKSRTRLKWLSMHACTQQLKDMAFSSTVKVQGAATRTRCSQIKLLKKIKATWK